MATANGKTPINKNAKKTIKIRTRNAKNYNLPYTLTDRKAYKVGQSIL